MTKNELAKMLHNAGITVNALNEDPDLLAVVYMHSNMCLLNTQLNADFKYYLFVSDYKETEDLLVDEGWKETLSALQELEDG